MSFLENQLPAMVSQVSHGFPQLMTPIPLTGAGIEHNHGFHLAPHGGMTPTGLRFQLIFTRWGPTAQSPEVTTWTTGEIGRSPSTN